MTNAHIPQTHTISECGQDEEDILYEPKVAPIFADALIYLNIEGITCTHDNRALPSRIQSSTCHQFCA